MPTVASIYFESLGERKIVYIPNVVGKAETEAFALAIQTYTKAAVVKSAFTQTTDLPGTATSGDLQDVDLFLAVKMRRQDTKKPVSCIIPAPDMSYLELVQDRGYRLKQVPGEAITTLLEMLTGLDLEFEEGWVCGES
jgi:hypothetical protein